MTGQQAAGILNIKAALKHRLHQIAGGAYYGYDQRYNNPVLQSQAGVIMAEYARRRHTYKSAAYKSFPGFFRRMAFKKLGTPNSATNKVCAGIVTPKHY